MRYPELDYGARLFNQNLDSGYYVAKDLPIYAEMNLIVDTAKTFASLPINEHMRIAAIEILPIEVVGTFEDAAYVFNLSDWAIYRAGEEFHSKFNGLEFLDIFNKKFQRRMFDRPMYCTELVNFGVKAAFLSKSLYSKIQGSKYKIVFHGCHLIKS